MNMNNGEQEFVPNKKGHKGLQAFEKELYTWKDKIFPRDEANNAKRGFSTNFVSALGYGPSKIEVYKYMPLVDKDVMSKNFKQPDVLFGKIFITPINDSPDSGFIVSTEVGTRKKDEGTFTVAQTTELLKKVGELMNSLAEQKN